MHLNVYTEILHQIFFNKPEFSVSLLNNLNNVEKKFFLRSVSLSRIENLLIKKIGLENIKSIFGNEEASWLKNNSVKRAIKTTENKSFAKKVSEELIRRKLNHVFLKGMNMHEHFYQNNLLRPLSDFDILIDKKNLCELLEICKKLDFDTSVWDSINTDNLIIYKNPTLKNNNKIAQIDIHTELKASPFLDSSDYKKFGQDLLEEANINNSPICSRENTFLHCLFHGTIQSNYNVGPIFILDMISMLKNHSIDWGIINKKVREYNLTKEFDEVMFYLSRSMKVSNNIFIKSSERKINSKDLKNILMTIPNNTSLFALKEIKDVKFLFEKIFYKKYLYEHSQQKPYLIYFFKNLFSLFKKHFLMAFSNNYANTISKKRYKILRGK